MQGKGGLLVQIISVIKTGQITGTYTLTTTTTKQKQTNEKQSKKNNSDKKDNSNIIMYTYDKLNDALSSRRSHMNLKTIFYTYMHGIDSPNNTF